MGYGGKVIERQRARVLRAEAWTLQEIADELGVSKGSVSVWVRDVDFVPRPRNRGHPAGPKHPMRLKKEAEIERCRQEAELWAAPASHGALTAFALALYAGEGAKADGPIVFAPLANDSDPDGDPIALAAVPESVAFSNGETGLITRLDDGRLQLDPRSGLGVATFTYTIVDALGLPSAPATVTASVNRSPIAPNVDIEITTGSVSATRTIS